MSLKTAKSILNRLTRDAQYSSKEWRALSKDIRDERGHCAFCKSTQLLQVHHPYYDREKLLHEYDRQDLVVLCDACHREIESQLQIFRRNAYRLSSANDMKHINAVLLSGITHYGAKTFVPALVEFTKNERLVKNHAEWNK